MMPKRQGFSRRAPEILTALQQDLRNVVATALDANVGGQPWCPPPIAGKLLRLLSRRSRPVGGLLRQAVRLLRIAELASERGGYAGFLYLDVTLLRSGQFARAVQAAVARGALDGVATVSAKKVSFLEPQMHAEAGRFDLSFEQMPAVAAMLHIVVEALGNRLDTLCSPILGPRCTGTANQVAGDLEAAFKEWLSPRAENDHGLRQGKLVTDHIKKSGRGSELDPVNDAFILEFWAEIGSTDPNVDGFRIYQNAARHLLIYRTGLMDQELVRRAEAGQRPRDDGGDAEAWMDRARLRSDPGSWWDSETDEYVEESVGQSAFSDLFDERDAGSADDGEAADEDVGELTMDLDDDGGPVPLRSSLQTAGGWDSPLFRLFDIPSGRVKWITDKDRTLLANMLSDRPPVVEDAEYDDETDQKAQEGKSLFVDGPPSELYALTLARFTIFGGQQWSFLNPKGKREFEPGDRYDELRGQYAKLAAKLDAAIKAAAWVLLSHGHSMGVALAHVIDPNAVSQAAQVGAATGGNVVGLRRDPASQMRLLARALLSGQPAFRDAIEKAYKGIEREGFQRQQFDDEDVIDDMAEGAMPALRLLDYVRQAAGWLGAANLAIYRADLAVFHERFSAMYGVQLPKEEAGTQSAPA